MNSPRATRTRGRTLAVAAIVTTLLSHPAGAAVRELSVGGFAVHHQFTVSGDSLSVYDAMTGDISGWWDHTFSGATDMVVTWSYVGKGDSTVVTSDVHVAGQVEKGWPEVVDSVWNHFLIERFKPYAEARSRQRRTPGR